MARFPRQAAQAEVLRCLSEARTLAELREQIPQALEIVRTSSALSPRWSRYRGGTGPLPNLSRKSRQAYRHQTLSMIAAQELLARGRVAPSR